MEFCDRLMRTYQYSSVKFDGQGVRQEPSKSFLIILNPDSGLDRHS